jgi:hypothetical protein
MFSLLDWGQASFANAGSGGFFSTSIEAVVERELALLRRWRWLGPRRGH